MRPQPSTTVETPSTATRNTYSTSAETSKSSTPHTRRSRDAEPEHVVGLARRQQQRQQLVRAVLRARQLRLDERHGLAQCAPLASLHGRREILHT
eukprot:4005092-Pleurochrysis_carterae.AAC.1